MESDKRRIGRLNNERENAMSHVVRRCTKAGSWYSARKKTLQNEIRAWVAPGLTSPPAGLDPSAVTFKALVGPHAGLTYCGETGGMAYGVATSGSRPLPRRVFVLGPTHYESLRGCQITKASVCQSPIRNLSVDVETVEALVQTGKFEHFTMRQEEQEHSRIFLLGCGLLTLASCQELQIVPIIVGSISERTADTYGKLLAPYFTDPNTFFAISSDFCHWGRRFGYTYNDPADGAVWQSIEKLDRLGCDAITSLDTAAWDSYIKQYRNSICGKDAIRILLHTIKHANEDGDFGCKLCSYSQSSRVVSMSDSSVSYASLVFYQNNN